MQAALLPSVRGRTVIGAHPLTPNPCMLRRPPPPRDCPSHRARTPRVLRKLPSFDTRTGLSAAPSKVEKRTQCQHLPKEGVCDLSG